MPRNVEIDDALTDEIFNERMDSEFEKIKQERDDYKNKYLYAVADKENAIKRIKSQMSIAADAEKTNIVTLPVLKDMGFAVQPSMVSSEKNSSLTPSSKSPRLNSDPSSPIFCGMLRYSQTISFAECTSRSPSSCPQCGHTNFRSL